MAWKWIAPEFGDIDVLQFVETELPAPGAGEVTIRVRAAGVNPADYKHIGRGSDRSLLPLPVGYEVSGVIAAIGPGAEIASGGGAVGDEVLAFRVRGGYASELNVPARDVFAKPASLDFPEAANLLLAGTTAAEMLHVTKVGEGDIVLLHAASGAVGVSVAQQAARLGARVIGTAGEHSFPTLRRFGVEPVAYGPGLEDRVRALAPEGVDAALDAAGTQEAAEVSAALLRDRSRAVTIVANPHSEQAGFIAIGGAMPDSAAYRDSVRAELIAQAAGGSLVVPLAQGYPLREAREALTFLKEGHPGGKLWLVP